MQVERIVGAFPFATRAAMTLGWREWALLRKQAPSGYFAREFFLNDYYKFADLDQKKMEQTGVDKTMCYILGYWVWADGYLDSRQIRETDATIAYADFTYKGFSHAEKLSAMHSTVAQSQLSRQQKQEIGSLIEQYRGKAIREHVDFMQRFAIHETLFPEVMEYRLNTTGDAADLLMRLLQIAGDLGWEKLLDLKQIAIPDAIGWQFVDDMVDCVDDYKGNRPNLVNALLLEDSAELVLFEKAIQREDILRKMLPYDILDRYAPKTLGSVQEHVAAIAKNLPKARAKTLKSMWCFASLVSHTPNFAGHDIKFIPALSHGTTFPGE